MNKNSVNFAIISTLLGVLMPLIDNAAKLRNILMKARLQFNSLRSRSIISITLTVVLSMTLLLSIVPYEAQASGGAYKIWIFAADPSLNKGSYLPTYEKLTPASLPSPGTAGRYADPLPNAVLYATPTNYDGANSLTPKDMALGQIIPFEISITVDGNTAPENGMINFTTVFYTNTTGHDNFGFDPAYMVYAAFVDTADPGTIDPGNNAKVDSYYSILTGSGDSKEIHGTFNLSGLDNGDRVIVEVWVVLKSTIPASSSGNVQMFLKEAKTATGDAINFGVQTISLSKVKEFFTNNADVSVVKTDSPDPLIQGQNLTYSLLVKNNSTDTVANGIIVTDTLNSNTSFVSSSGAPYTINGNNVTFNVGSLCPGQYKVITIATKASNTAPANNDTSISSETGNSGSLPTLFDLLNIASETAITSDPNSVNNVYYQPTNVLLASPSYVISKKVTNVANQGSTGKITKVGDVVSYQISVSNVGNIDLTNITLDDYLINLSEASGDNSPLKVLSPGETWTYTGNYTATQMDIDSNGGGNGLIENTATVDCDQLDPKSNTAEVPITVMPSYTISKAVMDVAGQGPTGKATKAGDVINYQISVSNVGNVDLTNITLSDSLINLTGPSGDAVPLDVLDPGEIWTYTGNYTVTQTDINSAGGGNGLIENTVTVDCDQLDSKSHSAEVPVRKISTYDIDKMVTDVGGKGPSGVATKAGDIISYRINVSNSGNSDLTNINITDSLINLAGPTESKSTDGVLETEEYWTRETPCNTRMTFK
jgi:uncharacterized repeat protein (TIGR01451 family)